jgi:hypothetical protein
MEWKIEYISTEDYLYIRTKGVLTAQSANSMVREIVEASARHQCDRQIVDHRETSFALDLFEYYERPEVNKQIGISQRWKIAMIFRELDQNTLFMETVFRNRGYNFREFDDLEKAKRWLLGAD